MCHASEYDHLTGPEPMTDLERELGGPFPDDVYTPLAPKPCVPSKPCAKDPAAPCAIHRPGIHRALASYLDSLPRIDDAVAYALSLR